MYIKYFCFEVVDSATFVLLKHYFTSQILTADAIGGCIGGGVGINGDIAGARNRQNKNI